MRNLSAPSLLIFEWLMYGINLQLIAAIGVEQQHMLGRSMLCILTSQRTVSSGLTRRKQRSSDRMGLLAGSEYSWEHKFKDCGLL
jgi:hypothetical protein